jgi:hypothetical protein
LEFPTNNFTIKNKEKNKMANSKLLKEAIADAKAVKETALANAKLALEEAFTPRLQSILSQKMRAEAEEMDADQEATNEELDSTGIGSKVEAGYAETPGANPTLSADTDLSVGVTKDGGKPEQAGTDYKKVADINEEEENPFADEQDPAAEIAELRARLAELEGETSEEDPFAAQGEAPSENPFGMEDEEEDPMAAYGDDQFGGEEDSEDGMDLESIIRELEAQLGDEEGSEEEMPAEEDPNAAQIAELRRQLAELEGDEEEEPTMESKRLRESRRRLKENLADGSEAGTDKGETPKVVVTNEAEGDDEESGTIDLEEILREMGADYEDSAEDKKADAEAAAELNEAYKTIKSLQRTINEVNLLNAKLLFANKLFRAHNMTNEQKVKVIETLDRTKSVREVKLVYSTLAENFKYTSSSNKTAKKSISEGIASKVTKSTKPAVSKQVIAESTQISDRFKKLAGIIK